MGSQAKDETTHNTAPVMKPAVCSTVSAVLRLTVFFVFVDSKLWQPPACLACRRFEGLVTPAAL